MGNGRVPTLSYGHGLLRAIRVERSWNGLLADSSAAGAVSAIYRAISAASACAARGHPSCKRQVSGSIPLTGSQVRRGKAVCVSRFVERTSSAALPGDAPADVTDSDGRFDETRPQSCVRRSSSVHAMAYTMATNGPSRLRAGAGHVGAEGYLLQG